MTDNADQRSGTLLFDPLRQHGNGRLEWPGCKDQRAFGKERPANNKTSWSAKP